MMSEKLYSLYIHINKINNKPYIGVTCQSLQERWGNNGQNYQKQPKFYNAIKKYGWNGFYHIELLKDIKEDEIFDIETEYIDKYDAIENGYNVLRHGINSFQRSKSVYCETTNKIYNSIREATRETGIDGYRIIKNCRGENGPQKGLNWFYWDKEKQQKINKKEYIKPLPKNVQPVYCVELDQIFPSVNETERSLQLDSSGLNKALNGKRNGVKGMHFVRVKDLPEINLIDLLSKRTGKERKIYCKETEQIFSNLEEASLFCARSKQTVMKNCQGKLKSCGGYHFQYYEDFLKQQNNKDSD